MAHDFEIKIKLLLVSFMRLMLWRSPTSKLCGGVGLRGVRLATKQPTELQGIGTSATMARTTMQIICDDKDHVTKQNANSKVGVCFRGKPRIYWLRE